MFETLSTHTHFKPTVASLVGMSGLLAEVPRGTRARIVQIDGGQRMRKRLADLGLAVGMEVLVLRDAHGHGPMILAVRQDTRLALGWGMASKITARIEG